MTMTFTIEYHCDGLLRKRFIVPVVESGIVGCYSQGKPFQPCNQEVVKNLPYNKRKAFERASKWWQHDDLAGRSMPLTCELESTKGKAIGSLFAIPDWV